MNAALWLAAPAPEFFSDIPSEEAVLSYMLWKNHQSKALTVEHFTGSDRRTIFAAIQEGAPFETIERLPLDFPGYATDLFFAPASSPGYLREAVESLIRMAALRKLDHRVMAWRRRSVTLDLRRARAELAECLR